MKRNIWKEELARCFLNWHFPCAVLLIIILYLLVTFRYAADQGMDVLYYYRLVTDNDFIMISYSLSAWVYTGVYCDENKHMYEKFILLRVPADIFIKVRMSVCVLSGAIVKIFGVWGYLLLMRMQHNFLNPQGMSIREFARPGWGLAGLVTENRIFLYFFLEVFLSGLLAGIFTGVAFYASLFLKDKVAVIVFPVFLNYFLIYYGIAYWHLPGWLQINKIFDSSYNVFGHDVASYLYGVGCFGLVWAILCFFAKIRYRKLAYE